MIAFVITCAVIYGGLLLVTWIADARDEADAAAEAALAEQAADWDEPTRSDIEATWDDEALGRVLAALDEAEVARFRAELKDWGGAA